MIPFPTPDNLSPWTSSGVTRGPHTENSGAPFLGLVCSRLNRKPTKGFIQSSEGGPPKTDFIPSHRSRRSHVGFSLFSLSISWERKKSKWAAAAGKPWAGTEQEGQVSGHHPNHTSWCQPCGPLCRQPGSSHQARPHQTQLGRGLQVGAKLTRGAGPLGQALIFLGLTNMCQVPARGLELKGMNVIQSLRLTQLPRAGSLRNGAFAGSTCLALLTFKSKGPLSPELCPGRGTQAVKLSWSMGATPPTSWGTPGPCVHCPPTPVH